MRSIAMSMPMQTLALFDLDNTLLTGDSEVLWADFLVSRGLLGDCFAQIGPRIPDAARELVQQHRDRGDLLVLTSVTSRFLVELTAGELGFEHVIATELEVLANGSFAGRTRDVLNMREGKVMRLRNWLAARDDTTDGLDAQLARAFFYSDSINDLPLLLVVGQPVVVDPDARLAVEAQQRHWPVLRLARGLPSSSSSSSA